MNEKLEDLVLSKARGFLDDYKAAEEDVRNGQTVVAGDFFAQLEVATSGLNHPPRKNI